MCNIYAEIYKLLIPMSVVIKTICRDVCNLPISYTNTHTGRRQDEFFNNLAKIKIVYHLLSLLLWFVKAYISSKMCFKILRL